MPAFEFNFEIGHPNAQALMKEAFYWDPLEEFGPFGNDDGWDAAYGYRQWRMSNKSTKSIEYLQNLMASWGYPQFDWYELDTNKIQAFMISQANIDEETIQQQIRLLQEASKNSPNASGKGNDTHQLREIVILSANVLGGRILQGYDNAIIGTTFAQLVMEGWIDRELKILTTTAIKRQLLPILLNRYDEVLISKRREQLNKMLQVILQVESFNQSEKTIPIAW